MNGGGHTIGILEKEHGARVLGIEWDPDIVENLKFKIKNEKLESLEKNLTIVNDSYVNLKQIIEKNDFQPDGIVFDLGVSSVHYEKSGRGFSFQKNEMLDMRFNPETETITAADIVNKESRERLEEIFRVYGEEQFAETIALNITKDRAIKPIIMTDELVAIVNASVPGWYKHKKIHPATK
ncbi:16S rRNA (cytosine(1402)-N(4))-methyltransferase, partial [Candidatus Curtissbacteria bacterium RIFCSPHIGHO2_02_39_8]